jgi:DNA helicase-2/ATP-dependent DNA helicase PcrA
MKEEKFQELYKRLNSKQRQAVDTIDGPVMVIAGPGTGKTSILTLRIANILRKTDTPANGILAITYTDAGVKAMRAKLENIIGERAHDVRVHTFHGFASSVIAEYPDHFLHVSDMKQMTDIEQESLIRSIISDPVFSSIRPTGKPDAYVQSILRSIDSAKREALTPEMVRHHAADEAERIHKDESSLSTRGATKGQLKAEAREAIEKCERTILFGDVYKRYESEKRAAKKMDFNDLIIELLLSLRNDELLLRLLQERYLYIHVDEHQDTNDAQNFIVGLIAEFFETPNIFIVGDEKQAIYRFQGASVENFLLLQKRWPAMKVISLDTNYRSHQSILDASFGMIEKNYAEGEHSDLRIRLAAGGKDPAQPIDIITAENIPALEVSLADQLKTLPKGVSAAIIVRRNKDLDRVIRLLESQGISVSSERSIDIFNHPAGQLFFDLLDYIADPSRFDALAKTVMAGMWGLSFSRSVELIRSLKSGTVEDLNSVLKELPHINNRLVSDSAVSFIIYAGQLSGFVSCISKDPSSIHVWRGVVSLAESLVRESGSNDPRKLIEGMLAYKLSAESRPVKVSVGSPDAAITAMTAHGSKGLEFDQVFIPYATEESWVSKPRGASFILPKKQVGENDIRDTRRLFYVALTRARRHVTILTALEESDGKILSPLRFLQELDEKHISYIRLPKKGAEDVYGVRQTDGHAQSSPIADSAKHMILEKGLSVTALNHFLECPNKFVYQSVFKLPQALAASAEKGTAMHEALSRVWKSDVRNDLTIEKILIETIDHYFDASLLSLVEKEAARKELIEDIPAVAKALESHFAVPKEASVFTETWIKTEFKGVYGSVPIVFPLHGKLDALIATGARVSVFDYKTKQAMSVNAIKGETKSDSDGNFFRQLVFYKILVSEDARFSEKEIIPSLVFVSPDEKGRCPIITVPIEKGDKEKVEKEIQTLIDSVWSGKIALTRCDDQKCEWCALAAVSQR